MHNRAISPESNPSQRKNSISPPHSFSPLPQRRTSSTEESKEEERKRAKWKALAFQYRAEASNRYRPLIFTKGNLVSNEASRLSPVWRPLRFILRSNKHRGGGEGGRRGLVQRPDFCDLAWPWKTGRMLRDRGCKRRHASWERERSRGTSHERAYERFEVARISLGQPCLVTPLVSYLDRQFLDPTTVLLNCQPRMGE